MKASTFAAIIVMVAITILIIGIWKYQKSTRLVEVGVPQPEPAMELVVATCMENLDWLGEYSKKFKRVTVYSKCNRERMLPRAPNITILPLPNVGSCDYVYLTHIIDNYDDLLDVVEFSKGRPRLFERSPLPLVCTCCAPNSSESQKILDFSMKDPHLFGAPFHAPMNEKYEWNASPYSTLGDWADVQEGHIDRNNFHRDYCNVIYQGYFTVTRTMIHQTSKETYIYFQKQQKHAREEVDHFFERMWGPLFCKGSSCGLAIVAIGKNELDARTWALHHLSQGVEHFYIIDNGSTNGWTHDLQGLPVTIRRVDIQYREDEMFSKFFLHIVRHKAKFVMVIDVNEYVYARGGNTISNILQNIPSDVGVIKLRLKMFESDQYKRVHGSTNRIKMNKTTVTIVKSIVRTSVLHQLNVHEHDTEPCKILTLPQFSTEESLKKADLQINHYVLKCEDILGDLKVPRDDYILDDELANILLSKRVIQTETGVLPDNFHTLSPL
jgi:hypothetical protein